MDCVKSKRSSPERRYSGQSMDEIYDERYKAAVTAYHNYMEGFKLILSENERQMRKILDRRSVPLWFQELSDEQVEAMNQLLGAIRDDFDEDVITRCRSLIRQLGVYPLCRKDVFREALILCRGNDLSFLWFLLELQYSKSQRAHPSKDYSINERLLMSSICHLDMMTTLRGLESVLPPPAPKKCRRPTSSCDSSASNWLRNIRHCSPYLEPQRIADVRADRTVNVHPEAPFCLARYASYRNPDFIIPNEASRWFAKKTQGNQTSFVSTDGEAQKTISLRDKACDSAEMIVKELLNDQIALMVAREDERNRLCRKHRDMERRRKKLLGLVTKRTEAR